MLWIGMGELFETVNFKGETVKKSTMALHVQATWRIVNKPKKEIRLASSDFYSPNSATVWSEDFDWDVQGNNLFDEKARLWLTRERPIYIKEYKINRWGDLLLILSNDDCLEIYVAASDDTECWRMLKYCSDEEHLVVTGLGYEFE